MILNSPYITGSLTVTGNATIAGNITVTGSLSGTAATASFALTLGGTGSVGFATTGAFSATSGSASSRLTQIEQVYATTGSNSFRATQSITGSLTVTGQIIAQTLNVQQVTSSIVFSSGSNTFGCDLNSRQTFTGSVLMTGSLIVNTTGPELQVNNNGVILGNLLTDNHSITGSLRVTGSNVTIAGALCGTSATFAGNVIIRPSSGYNALFQVNSTTLRINYLNDAQDTNVSAAYRATDFTWQNCLGQPSITLTSGGNFGIGTSTVNVARLEVVGGITSLFTIDSAVNSATYGGSIFYRTTNTVGNGNGLTFSLNDSASSRAEYGYIGGIIETNTNGSHNGAIVFAPARSGARTEATRITSCGNVGIGYESPSVRLQVNGTIAAGNPSTTGWGRFSYDASTNEVRIQASKDGIDPVSLAFYTQASGGGFGERMRVTSLGYTKASSNGSYWAATAPYHEFGTNTTANWTTIMFNSSASPFGLYIPYSGGSPNNSGNESIYFADSSALRFSVRSNGGIANFQANDANLSDERTKKDITPLESYWDKFKQIEIVKFKYKDQTHDDFNIGVIAQQVETVAPEFVDVDGWGKPELDEEGNEIVSDEEPLKSIYTADLHHATIKVLQEAMAKIETQQCTINILKTCIGIA